VRRPAGEPRNRRAVRRRRWSTTAAPTPRRARAPRWRRGVVPPLGPPLSLPSPFAPLVARAASSPRVVPSLSPCGLAASSSQGSHRHRACHAPPAAAASLEPTMRVPRSSPPLALPPCPHLTCTPSRHARSDAPPVCRAPRRSRAEDRVGRRRTTIPLPRHATHSRPPPDKALSARPLPTRCRASPPPQFVADAAPGDFSAQGALTGVPVARRRAERETRKPRPAVLSSSGRRRARSSRLAPTVRVNSRSRAACVSVTRANSLRCAALGDHDEGGRGSRHGRNGREASAAEGRGGAHGRPGAVRAAYRTSATRSAARWSRRPARAARRRACNPPFYP